METIVNEQQNIAGDVDDLRNNIIALNDVMEKNIKPRTQIDEPCNGNAKQKDKKTYMCELCQKMFASGFSLKRHNNTYHLATSTKEPKTKSTQQHPFKCNECTDSFRTNEMLNKHISRKHADPEKPMLVCKECTKEFVSVYNLKDHITRIHRRTTSTAVSTSILNRLKEV